MTTTRDFTELDKQIDNAEAHAIDMNAKGRKWGQKTWFSSCGSYGCLAGNTVLDDLQSQGVTGVFAGATWYDYLGRIKEYYGEPVDVVAAQRLGLSKEEASLMFSATNTIGMLRKLQKDLHNGEPIDNDKWQQYYAEDPENQ